MGLAKSPDTFQIVVDVVLCGLSSKPCLVYPDDIIVFSRTSDEHSRFSKVSDCRPKTYRVCVIWFNYLGHIDSDYGVN